jgi:hypothetical protein
LSSFWYLVSGLLRSGVIPFAEISMPYLLIERKRFFKVFVIYFSGQFQETGVTVVVFHSSCSLCCCYCVCSSDWFSGLEFFAVWLGVEVEEFLHAGAAEHAGEAGEAHCGHGCGVGAKGGVDFAQHVAEVVKVGLGGGVDSDEGVDGAAAAGVNGGDGHGDLGDDAQPVCGGEVVTLENEVAPGGDAGLAAAGEGLHVAGVADFPWLGVPLAIYGIGQKPDAVFTAAWECAGLGAGLGVWAHHYWAVAGPPGVVSLAVGGGEDEDDFALWVEGAEEGLVAPCAGADIDGADAAQPGVVWLLYGAEGADAGGEDGVEGDAAGLWLWLGRGLLPGGGVGIRGAGDVAAGGGAEQVAALGAGVPGCGADLMLEFALAPLGAAVGEVPLEEEVEGGGLVEGKAFDKDGCGAEGGIVPAAAGDGWFKPLDVGAGALYGAAAGRVAAHIRCGWGFLPGGSSTGGSGCGHGRRSGLWRPRLCCRVTAAGAAAWW